MTNRRNRQQDPGDDQPNEVSTETCDESVTSRKCPHITKAVNFSNMKKYVQKNGIAAKCITCTKTRNGQAADEPPQENSESPVSEMKSASWLCLQCGHLGCGRNDQGHALEHYMKPHSDCHSVVADTFQWTVWCYQCENAINSNCWKKLGETVEFVKTHSKTASGSVDAGTRQTNVKNLIKSQQEKLKPKDTVQSNFPKGLINPGNNCFFNAVLQCLAQTPYIIKILQDINVPGKKFVLPGGTLKIPNTSQELELPPIEGTLEGWGHFTSILCDTLLKIRSPTDNSGFYPSEIISLFRKKSTQCLDDGQHDSHELLRHLLELVRNEDLRRYQSVILRDVGLNGKTNPEDVEKKVKFIIKFYGNQASKRLLGLEPVFRGILISTLECLNCHHTSQKIEPFLDLSLPIMADKPQPPGVKRANVKSDQDLDSSGNRLYEGSSKHQLKEERKAARRNRKQSRRQQNKKINFENALLNNGVTEDTNGCSAESDESDADVEDNIEIESSPSDIIECTRTSVNNLPLTKDADTNDSTHDAQTENHLQSMTENENVSERRKKRRGARSQNVFHNGITDITTELSEVDIAGAVDQSPTTKSTKEGECSIQSCLNQFTALELMTGSNKVACETCTAREKQTQETSKMICTSSTKQYLISRVPAVLILHLKRCEAQRIDFRKVTKHVPFPLTLDLAFVCRRQTKPRIYSLYGVVQHSGTVHGGHYTAYVKSRTDSSPKESCWSFLPTNDNANASSSSESDSETDETAATVPPVPGKWFHISDSRVIEVDEKTVLKSQAYLLFYERIF